MSPKKTKTTSPAFWSWPHPSAEWLGLLQQRTPWGPCDHDSWLFILQGLATNNPKDIKGMHIPQISDKHLLGWGGSLRVWGYVEQPWYQERIKMTRLKQQHQLSTSKSSKDQQPAPDQSWFNRLNLDIVGFALCSLLGCGSIAVNFSSVKNSTWWCWNNGGCPWVFTSRSNTGKLPERVVTYTGMYNDFCLILWNYKQWFVKTQ